MPSVNVFVMLACLAASLSAYGPDKAAKVRLGSKRMATCTGSASCRACKNCRYCAHCAKHGGRCGVCR